MPTSKAKLSPRTFRLTVKFMPSSPPRQSASVQMPGLLETLITKESSRRLPRLNLLASLSGRVKSQRDQNLGPVLRGLRVPQPPRQLPSSQFQDSRFKTRIFLF